jgi:hypothetical protein
MHRIVTAAARNCYLDELMIGGINEADVRDLSYRPVPVVANCAPLQSVVDTRQPTVTHFTSNLTRPQLSLGHHPAAIRLRRARGHSRD